MDEVIKVSGEAYPELVEKESYIKKVIRIEEEKFNETIEQGMEILASYIADLKKNGETTLSGENAFKLYDTYGFPIDLTQEILEEEHLSIDEEAFNGEMNKQIERARSARGNMDGESWKEDPLSKLDSSVASTFEGYFELENSGIIKAIVKDNELVDSAVAGDKVIVVLDKTTFYPEGGGQAGDAGLLVNKNEDIVVEVIDTKKGANNTIKHIGIVKSGMINTGEKLSTIVDKEIRMASARNHSATHLLHKALKEVLGEHVNQAGSLVTSERLRFDVTHFEAITKEELKVIEEKVRIDGNINTYIMYMADDSKDKVRGLTTSLDFSESIQIANCKEGMNCKLNTKLKSIEAKVINGRKVGIKAAIEIEINIYSNEEVEIVNKVQNAEDIQILKEDLKTSEYMDHILFLQQDFLLTLIK